MMCEDVSLFLSAYRDGELPEDVMKQVSDHVATCQKCSDTLLSYGVLTSTVSDWAQSIEVPAFFESSVLRQIEEYDRVHMANRAKVGTVVATVAMIVGLLTLAFTPLGSIMWMFFRILGSGLRSVCLTAGHAYFPGSFSGSVVSVASTCFATVLACIASLVYIQRRWSVADGKVGGFR